MSSNSAGIASVAHEVQFEDRLLAVFNHGPLLREMATVYQFHRYVAHVTCVIVRKIGRTDELEFEIVLIGRQGSGQAKQPGCGWQTSFRY